MEITLLPARRRTLRQVPNDPLLPRQWHLQNTGQVRSTAERADLNIIPAWNHATGAGVVIGIVDDGLQITHPDLSANSANAFHHDWNDTTPDDPTPTSGDSHGTACAGLAAARSGNSLGISGAAPAASLAGLRLVADFSTDASEAEAMEWLP